MRELTSREVVEVSGGFVGTPIPFYNGFIGGPNFPGGYPAAIPMLILSFDVGFKIGTWISNTTKETFGMSIGEAAYKTLHENDS